MAHRHKAETERIGAYTGGITEPDGTQEPRAHGGIRVHETCACGATRTTNRNQGYRESTGWVVRRGDPVDETEAARAIRHGSDCATCEATD
jgi:hypothetical protein